MKMSDKTEFIVDQYRIIHNLQYLDNSAPYFIKYQELANTYF